MTVGILCWTVIALLSMVLGFMLFGVANHVLRKLTRPLYPNPPDSLNHSPIYMVIREQFER